MCNNILKTSIENGFPIDFISLLAKHESWRKEVYRPLSYLHKWWARRLGSVFRGIIIGACSDSNSDIKNIFYKPLKFRDKVIYDPFMGSGTTVIEALKLGCKVIGQDINPISYTAVKAALQHYDRKDLITAYNKLEEDVGHTILDFYKTEIDGVKLDVLYYFWVKTIKCPDCGENIDLFSSRIFSKHAYPKKNPQAQSLCPYCNEINTIHYDDKLVTCSACRKTYNPQIGNINKSIYTCPKCGKSQKIIDYVKNSGEFLKERMYAKLILDEEGNKKYLPINEFDIELYNDAEKLLSNYIEFLPSESIEQGYNTKQVLNYNYKYWKEMFNSRQLLCLAMLGKKISEIEDRNIRFILAVLFSGVLEFNNMFTSFKGEGTGAVRHMFFNHILKPELTPLEANIWGTPKSSGSFSTLFKSRIIRILDYKEAPFEVAINKNKKEDKVYLEGIKIDNQIVETIEDLHEGNVLLCCGDSAKTIIPDKYVDFIVTDPPFFDNVNYSELADFFYVWLKRVLPNEKYMMYSSTRSNSEVQDTNSESFCKKLKDVFTEGNRVLKDEGLLIFTYHHSKTDGWISVYKAIKLAGFEIVNTFPIKSEMSVSVPIMQSRTPINYDLIFVCRKSKDEQHMNEDFNLEIVADETKNAIKLLKDAGLEISIGDEMVIAMGKILTKLSINGMKDVDAAFLSNMLDKVVTIMHQ